MTDAIHAERATITVAGKELEVFRMPDGSYRYSQTSVAKAISKGESDTRHFLASNYAAEVLPERVSGVSTPATLIKVGRTRVSGLTDIEASAYWAWKLKNGCIEALALVTALMTEALHRRASEAFGVTVTSEALEERTTMIRHQLINKALGYEVGFREAALKDDSELAHSQAALEREILDTLTDEERKIYDKKEDKIVKKYKRLLVEKICARNGEDVQRAHAFNRALGCY